LRKHYVRTNDRFKQSQHVVRFRATIAWHFLHNSLQECFPVLQRLHVDIADIETSSTFVGTQYLANSDRHLSPANSLLNLMNHFLLTWKRDNLGLIVNSDLHYFAEVAQPFTPRCVSKNAPETLLVEGDWTSNASNQLLPKNIAGVAFLIGPCLLLRFINHMGF
jgi:hypothetical protein